jgi:hydroxyacylglutathione hydrolase
MNNVSIVPVPAFNDNYLWLLHTGTQAWVVDPGDAAPVLDYLRAHSLQLAGIFVTHHHPDHIGGIPTLLREFPRESPDEREIVVYGPARENIPSITHPLQGGETLTIAELGGEIEVLAVPGHTAGHLAYYGAKLGATGALFSGDTLFGGGCGRLFEGTPAQMHASLQQIAVLPALTSVYCAHEYTEANLRFARAVEPDNAALTERIARVSAQRARGEPTVPLSLAEELASNPFLRCTAPAVRAAAAVQLGHEPPDAVETFAAIRRWKDVFR